MVILIVGQMMNAFAGSVGYLLNMTGGQKIMRNIAGIAALLNIVLNTLLIPSYGINGAAYASAISLASWNVLAVIYIKQHYGFYTVWTPIR